MILPVQYVIIIEKHALLIGSRYSVILAVQHVGEQHVQHDIILSVQYVVPSIALRIVKSYEYCIIIACPRCSNQQLLVVIIP